MSISRVISLFVIFFRRHGHGRAFLRIAACAVLVSVLSSPVFAKNTIVRMEISFGSTPAGNIDIELYDDEAPKTVQNFLRYAGYYYHLRCDVRIFSSCYNYSYNVENPILIHRSAGVIMTDLSSPRFAIQGGGYYYLDSVIDGLTGTPVPVNNYDAVSGPSVPNEYSSSHENTLGTISMALSQDNSGRVLPDSATSQWFINLTNNSTRLFGYTVFGHVRDPGMETVNRIAELSRVYLGRLNPVDPSDDGDYSYSPFGELPVLDNYDSVTRPKLKPLPENLVSISRIPNVAATRTDLGTVPTYAADVDMVFSPIEPKSRNDALAMLASFSSPANQSVHFNNGIHTFSVSGIIDPAGEVVTMYDGAATRPTHYYGYGGATPDNPAHWYDFSYDRVTGTGAEIVGDKIILHFVDNQRGDDDPTVNSITHTGGQAVVTSTASTDAQSGGCSISARNPGALRAGDWILVSLFLAFVALARRCARRNRVQRCSPDAGA